MIRIAVAILASTAAAWRCRRGLLIRAMESSLYALGMRWVVPWVRLPWRHACLPDWKIRSASKLVKAGDILMSTTRWKLTSFFIPGKMKHAAWYVKSGRGDVVEAVAAGFRPVSFSEFCKADHVMILRPDWDDPDYTQKVVERSLSFIGIPYDTLFRLGLRALYCFESIFLADFEKRLGISTEDLMGLGRQYVSSAGILNAKVTVIWDSDLLNKAMEPLE